MDTPSTRLTLLALLKATPGDERAWSEFVARYGPAIALWCREQRMSPAAVEELTQEVLVSLFQAFKTFQYDAQRGRFRAYLYTVTRRAISNWLKSGAKRPRTSMDTVLNLIPAQEDLLHRLHREFDVERLHMAMRNVQARVQPSTWTSFQATELEGRRAAEVAAELGLTVASVNVYRSRIRSLIRKELEWFDGKRELDRHAADKLSDD